MGTLPNQTHERAQGYRLLAEIMATAVASNNGDAGEWMYQVGVEWGRHVVARKDSQEPVDETEVIERLADKLDALWFAPEIVEESPRRLVLHNCPFMESTRRYAQVMCQLHAGMINGSLEEMGSATRLVHLKVLDAGHKCDGELARTTARMPRVPLEIRQKPPYPA